MFYKSESAGYRQMLPGVQLKTLTYGERTLLAEVRLDQGSSIPMHQHPQEQTGYLVSGSLRFHIGDRTIIAKPGDGWNIRGGVVHGAEALEDSVVIEAFSPIREDYLPQLNVVDEGSKSA